MLWGVAASESEAVRFVIYHPRYLTDDAAFEVMVHLVLEQEHPLARIRRRRHPDWGIDITQEDGSAVHAYQCKHYRRPQSALLTRELRKSLSRAIEHRSKLFWKDFTLCTSEDLTGDQVFRCQQIALALGLESKEFHIRSGTQFVSSLAKNPWIWQAVTNNDVIRSERISHVTMDVSYWVDSRLRQIVSGLLRSNSRQRLVDVLHDQGILEIAMNDWYEMAALYFDSTKHVLRMIAFEQEIPSFWLTKSGHRYFALNKRLLSQGIEVRRIYAVDLALAMQAPEILETMVAYMMQQAAAGIACRAMDRDAFSETLRLNCTLFGVQDEDNVALFSRDGQWVTIVRDTEFVKDAIDVYDELFHSRESIAPSSLHVSR